MENAGYHKKHRMKNFDYSSSGAYMVTFDVLDQKEILSSVEPSADGEHAVVRLTEIGKIVEKYILSIEDHYRYVRLENYVIMPNHVHILLFFCFGEARENSRKVQESKLSQIVHALKSLITKELGFSIWQSDYYDNIAFTDERFDALYEYIRTNPIMWLRKKEPSLLLGDSPTEQAPNPK